MDDNQIYRVLKYGSSIERKNIALSAPPSGMKESALPLIGSDNLSTSILGFNSLVMQYCNGSNPTYGAALAKALHKISFEIYTEKPDHGNLLPETLSGLASNHLNALNLMGRSKEVLDFSKEYIPKYETMSEQDGNVISLKLAKIQALLNLNEIDEAEKMLEDPKLLGNFATDIEVNRLKGKLEQMKAKIFDLKPGEKSPKKPGVEEGQQLLDILKGAIGVAFNGEDKDTLIKGVEQLDPSNRIDPNTKAGFDVLTDLLNQGEAVMTQGGGDNEWSIKGKVRNASAIFVHSTPPREDIERSLETLAQCLEWSIQNSHIEIQNDAYWGMYLCYSRSDRPSQAADALIELRKNLEAMRACIADFRERGGVFDTYPYLFDALCDKLQASGRAEDLFEAIEASKGRGVSDILARKDGVPTADAAVYGVVKQIPGLTKKHNFHYLTYYVDEKQTYAVVVCKNGKVHLTEPTILSKSMIREQALYVDPKVWGDLPGDGDPIPIEPIWDTLSPLVKALESFLDRGIIQEGDHLCYCSDDNFSNIPLHYLKLKGKPLIDTFPVSRIQNAVHLHQVLQAPVAKRPKQFVSFKVPTLENTYKENWGDMDINLSRPEAWLRQQLDGISFENTKGSVSNLFSQNLNDKIIHFATHGFFPNEASYANPFDYAGLILSDGAALPDEYKIVNHDTSAMLTPRKVFEKGLRLDNSHVSLMACVSGLSQEGTGGDALGLEWAFVQAGASSILSSHWMVSAKQAAEFFETFYDNWILKNKSKNIAFRDTVTALQKRGGEFAHPHCWAAFSLAGDWR